MVDMSEHAKLVNDFMAGMLLLVLVVLGVGWHLLEAFPVRPGMPANCQPVVPVCPCAYYPGGFSLTTTSLGLQQPSRERLGYLEPGRRIGPGVQNRVSRLSIPFLGRG